MKINKRYQKEIEDESKDKSFYELFIIKLAFIL